MTKKNIMLGVLGLAALGAVAFATGTYAYQGNPAKVGPGYGLHNGQGRGMMGQERGQNHGGNFIDSNKDGICDHMQ